MQIKPELAKHLVNESDCNFVNIHLPNRLPDHICQLGNLFNASFKHPESGIVDLKQVYRQSNCHEAIFLILQTNAQKKVFQYSELKANSAKEPCDDKMP